jgi:NADPH:quinone reductase-like Zn-dependent oxidoreductase
MLPATMQAVRVHEFGGPDVLRLDEVPRPDPGPGEVLVQVHAAGINPLDWYRREGYVRFPAELRPPRPALPYIPGVDASGAVAAVGPGVSGLRVGDEVFGLLRFPSVGDRGGETYAEYTVAPEEHLARKPAALDHVQAAAVPLAALTAYQFLFDHIRIGRDRTVLVNGAAGGVGHFLVQLARTHRARVIAVASTRHEAFLRELGADEFVDYTTTAVEDTVRGVDHVFDCVGGPDAHRLLAVLGFGGSIMPVFRGDYRPERAFELGISVHRNQVHSDGTQLAELARLADAGTLRPGVDSVFPLADAAKAHERAEQGHIQGKIVLQVLPG